MDTKAIDIVAKYNKLIQQENNLYINLMEQANEQCKEIMKDDLGSQFVHSCAKDLAGEVVRQFFDTSDFYITVDQLVDRIIHFSYDNDIDPLSKDVKKMVYNYSEKDSKTLQHILEINNESQVHLLDRVRDKKIISDGKEAYYNLVKNQDGSVNDEYTGKLGEYIIDKNGNPRRRQEVDHIQARATVTYNKRYITNVGVQELKEMMNSPDNFAMMDKVANGSKGDVRVYEKDGVVLKSDDIKKLKKEIKASLKEKYEKEGVDKSNKEIADEVEINLEKYDISYKATPKQLAETTCEQWEKTEGKKDATIKELKDKGYLNEDGKVPTSVRKQLEENIKYSQNVESKVILKNTDYKKVAGDAGVSTAKNLGKIIAGQVIYYAAPPFLFEVKSIVKDAQEKNISIDNVLDKIEKSGKRIGKYVYSHLKDILVNVPVNTIKTFIKTFMDILINLVKATVKKMLKMAKSLCLSVVDSIRIIVDKNRTPAEKADAVFSLLGVTITNIAIEALFECIEAETKLPEFLLTPFQIITSVVCSNLVIIILQKLDLFDVRFGFKMNKIEELFNNTRSEYVNTCNFLLSETSIDSNLIIRDIENETKSIFEHLSLLNAYDYSVREDSQKISDFFNMNVDFESSWNKYLGI